ncbi:MAG TPA: PQQ-binding-like beta-propeller repeat protein [Pyrinomonadaceae bacterium]|nr:PQQ-binding-like beta-propeller repeat protein [Pyrinomonadaceae bacterium]
MKTPTTCLAKRVLTLLFLVLGASFAFGDGYIPHANAQVALSQPLTIRWRYDSNLTLNLTPAFDQERIYLPLAGGMIVSLRARDGQLYWRSEMGGELSASPVADEHAVYVASEIGPAAGKTEAGVRRATGTLRALGREGGVTLWMRTLAMPLRGSLSLSGQRLIAGGSDGRLYAFNKETGGMLWSSFLGGSFNSQPVASGERVYAGDEDGNLIAVQETTGKLIWRYRTKGPIRGRVALANGTVYFGSGDGYLYAVNSATGRLLWRKRTGAGVEAVTLIDQGLLVASLDNFVYRYSLNGRRVWKRQLPGRISAQPLTAEDGVLFTPLSSPAGVVLGPKDGKQVNSLPTGEEITTSAAPIAVGDAVLLTTEHGFLAFAQPKQGATTQPSTKTAQPQNRLP